MSRIYSILLYTCVKFEVLTALRLFGCELTDSDKIFMREEMCKLQNSTSSNGFNIPDIVDGIGENIMLILAKKLIVSN